MTMSFKAASILGSIVVLIALVITFIKTLIAFVGFLTTAVQVFIVLAFIAVIGGVGFLIIRSWKENKKSSE